MGRAAKKEDVLFMEFGSVRILLDAFPTRLFFFVIEVCVICRKGLSLELEVEDNFCRVLLRGIGNKITLSSTPPNLFFCKAKILSSFLP